MKDKEIYSILLALADELDKKDFINYDPYKVVHGFWKKYYGGKNNLKLLDFIVCTKRFKNNDKLNRSEKEEFLHDFGMFMVATFAISFGEEGKDAQQIFISDNDAGKFGFFVWLSFIKKVRRMK